MINWYEASGVNLPPDVYLKINKRLDLIKSGLSEEEHVAISQTLLQASGVGPLRPGQTLELRKSNLGYIRALHTLLGANLSLWDDPGVTVDFGEGLEYRYEYCQQLLWNGNLTDFYTF